MIVEKEKIEEAKLKIGAEKTWDTMKRVYGLTNTDDRNHKACCPFHNEKTPSFILNEKTMKCRCFGCSRNADIIDAYMYEGKTYMQALEELFKEANMRVSFGEVGVKTKRDYKYPHPDDCGSKDIIYEYLAKRKISKETVDKAGLTQDDKGNIVFNYYDTNDVLTMCKYRPSHKIIKGKENKNWCQYGADTTPLLFNMNKVNTSLPLIATEGEVDCLAAIEAGFPNAVSVPFGSQNTQWIEHNWDWLEQFSEIIICSDNDEAGVKMRKEVIPRLGAWRTKYIDIPKIHHDEATGKDYPMKDLNEVLFYEGKEGVRKLFDSACDPGVPSVTNVSDIHDMDLDEVDGVTTGISEIDRNFMRLFYGTLTVVSGKPGSGKTSFLSQVFCHAMDEGKPVWMFSREMPDWMQKNWFNYILAGGHHITVRKTSTGTEYYKVANDAKEAIDKYYNNQWFLYRDEWSNKIDDVLASMEDSVRKYGAKLLIIDNLMMLDLGGSDDAKNERQTECVTRLIKFAMKYSVAVVLVAHPRKTPAGEELNMYDVAGSSNIINLAHRAIGLRRINQEKEHSAYNVKVTILKDRLRGMANKEINMYYDMASRRFYTNEEEYNHQYGWDNGHYDALPYPHSDEDEIFGEEK